MKTLNSILFFFALTAVSNFFSQKENIEKSNYQFDMIEYRVQDLELKNKILKEGMMRASYFTMISAKQKNRSIIIGIVGSVLSSVLITNDWYASAPGGTIIKRQTPVLGFAILGATAVASISMNICSNNNQKKASLEFEKIGLR